MEALVDSGLLTAVIDITTTEVADLLFGGVLPAGPDRFDCIARTKVPWVGSVGACDMINFWAPETMPEQYREPADLPAQPQRDADADDAGGEPRHRHLDRRKAQPLRGTGPPPHPREGRLGARYRGRRVLGPGGRCRAVRCARDDRCRQVAAITRLPLHINDPAFAEAAVAAFREIAR